MIKKSTSTSNVPNNNNNSGNIIQQNNQTNNTPPKMKNNHKNHSNQSNSSEIINSKHLHNQIYQQKPKKMKEASVNEGNNENILMKKLFEAVQKQKEKENSSKTRKATTTPTMNSSETYAGAAFDRAPAATSFPIPSFLKPGNSEMSDSSSTLSSSCPLLGLGHGHGHGTGTGFNETTATKEKINFKSLSITELFQIKNDVEITEKSEKKKLESLTNDLRRMLNLR